MIISKKDPSGKLAAITIQYVQMVIGVAISYFLTPFLISHLGTGEYGLYRIISSFADQLGVMSLGIGTIVTRNVSKYNELKDEQRKTNYLGMSMIIASVLAVTVIIMGWVLSFSIDRLFSKSLSGEDIQKAVHLYWIIIFNVAITVLNDMLSGIVNGNKRFAFKNMVFLCRLILRSILVIILILNGSDSYAVVATDLLMSGITFFVLLIYSVFVLHERIWIYRWDNLEFKQTLAFSFAMFLQAIVNQVNQNMDNIILGSMTSKDVVSLYSIALTIFAMFNAISTIVGSVYLPQTTEMVVRKATGLELTQFLMRPGKLQFFSTAMFTAGFIVLGRRFITIWVGSVFSNAYYISIILMLPALFVSVQNITSIVLDAMLKRTVRSIIMFIMALINVITSIVLIKPFGFYGAAYGTAISYIVGNGILLNIYLCKMTDIDLNMIYKEVIGRMLPFLSIIVGLFIIFDRYIPNGFIWFVFETVAFVSVYVVVMFFFYFNKTEKREMRDIIIRRGNR